MPEQAGTTPPGQLRGGGLVVSQKCNKMGYSGLPWPSAHTFDLPPHRGQTWATWRQAAGDTRQEAPGVGLAFAFKFSLAVVHSQGRDQ